MEKKYTLVLVSHTHWDREWYLPFQEFRIKLVRMTDKLLNILETDPGFKTFVFDGQTVVLEDYLEVRPEERERLKRFVQEGRLTVGPWYILPDEYLVSGEATVRNLLLGHLIAEQFGKPMKSGYVPDPFGHISQLPQILRNFGIEDFIFSRGLGLEKERMSCEFNWESPDGSSVLAIHQLHGYCSAYNLGYTREPDSGEVDFHMDLAQEKIDSELEALSQNCASTVLLLSNGCDHQPAQPEVPEIIKVANERLENAVVMHGTFEDLGRMIREQKLDLPTYRGELRAGRDMNLLPGVMSARMYIKQANERTQTLLEKWTEPFATIAHLYGRPYEPHFVWLAWKLLLQNHPHDSICGCSVDQVHREMMPRFEQSQQIGGWLARESLERIASQVNTVFKMPETAEPVVVFNALNWGVDEPVTVPVAHMLEQHKAPGWFVVRDPEGNVIPSQLSNLRRTELHRQQFRWECDLSFAPGSVPSMGYKTFAIDRVDFDHPGGRPPLSGGMVTAENALENEFVKVTVASNGSFDLLDKITGNIFEGCNLFEDTEDIGDEYDYSPARGSRTITSSGAAGTVTVQEDGPAFATIRVDTNLKLPVGLTVDRFTRAEATVDCPITVSITVRKGSPRVDVVTEFANNAKDHRLRAWFPSAVNTDVAQAEGQFDVLERPVEMPDRKDWWQKPQPEQPQQSFVNVQQQGRGLAVINQGLPEYEVFRTKRQEDVGGDSDRRLQARESGIGMPSYDDRRFNSRGRGTTIALTLLRCCGWLSTADMMTRTPGAGPEIATPDAQCLGQHVFRYAVMPHAGDWKEAKVWRYAHQHNVPLRAVFTPVHAGRLPRELSFVSVEPANLVVSALKKADRDESVILRLYNTTGEEVTAEVKLGFPIHSVELASMNEEPTGGEISSSSDGILRFKMPGFRVQTLRMSL